MAKIGETPFNAEDVEPGGFEPIPPGRYNMIITDSDYLVTVSQTGHYLKLEMQIIDGDYINRKLWTNLNLDNPNTKAVEIAQRELSALCRACGVLTIEDSQELHGIPFSAQVKIRPEQNGYPASNTVSGFKEPVDSNDDGGESPPWGE